MKNLIKALVDAKLIASTDVSEDTAVAQFVAAFSDITTSLADATAKAADTQTKLDTANQTIAANVKASAESAVASAVKSGRIKDDAGIREKWTAAYVRDEAGTKTMLDSLPEAKAPRGVAPVATGTKPDGSAPENRPTTESVWAKQFNK